MSIQETADYCFNKNRNMKSIKTDITINTTSEKIWAVLTDFDSYPSWNPFIKKISGIKEVGETIFVQIQPPESNPMSFKPEILCLDPNKEFRWKGKFLIKGLFDGEHYFILRQKSDGTTRFVQGENFSGLLVWFLGNALEKTKNGFVQMNEALKKQCEQV